MTLAICGKFSAKHNIFIMIGVILPVIVFFLFVLAPKKCEEMLKLDKRTDDTFGVRLILFIVLTLFFLMGCMQIIVIITTPTISTSIVSSKLINYEALHLATEEE